VLFRLTKARAQALGAKRLLPNGECRVCWQPSSFEHKKYPELPAGAAIEGRLIVVTQKGFRDSWYLFTTLSEETEAAQIAAWYRQRWNLELDLRTLKGTLRLKHMQGKKQSGGGERVADRRGGLWNGARADGRSRRTSRPAPA
jgi:hypothetical protein